MNTNEQRYRKMYDAYCDNHPAGHVPLSLAEWASMVGSLGTIDWVVNLIADAQDKDLRSILSVEMESARIFYEKCGIHTLFEKEA